MSDESNGKLPVLFWIIGVVALLWNLFGLFAYYSQVTATPETLADYYNQIQIDLIMATPKWVTSATALAVTAGVLGSIAMLLRKAWAIALFAVSLLALIVQDIYIFGMTNSAQAFGAQVIGIQATVILFGVFLVWYSRSAKAKGWLS